MGHTGEFELLILLAVLRRGEGAYGVTVLEELERASSRKLTLGTVYKALGLLELKGYVQTRIAPPTPERGGRRKKLYTLTSTGSEAARRSLADLRRLVQGVEPEVEVP